MHKYQAVNQATGERGPLRDSPVDAAMDMLDWPSSFVDIVAEESPCQRP